MRSNKAVKPAVQSHGFGCCPRPRLLGGLDERPGPGAYHLKSTLLGHAVDSRIRSTNGFSLRSRVAFGGDSTSSIRSAAAEPGPGAYIAVQCRSGGLMNDPRAAPRFSFPKDHFPRDKLRLQPGPGQYQLKDAMGPQSLSTKSNPPVSTFGRSRSWPSSSSSTCSAPGSTSSRRADLLKTDDVGPGSYKHNSACGKQVDSRKRNCGGIRFGTADGPSPPKPSPLLKGAKGGGAAGTVAKG